MLRGQCYLVSCLTLNHIRVDTLHNKRGDKSRSEVRLQITDSCLDSSNIVVNVPYHCIQCQLESISCFNLASILNRV